MSVFYPCDVSGLCPYAVENCEACKGRTAPKLSTEEEEEES